MAKPTREGDPITSGSLLRFVPNWDVIMWEYDRDRPSWRAWRLRRGEEYLSLYREADDDAGTSVEALKQLKPDFAIFRVSAEALIRLGNVRIEFKPVPHLPLGHAHVGVFGINGTRSEKLARDRGLTERVKGPGNAAPPPTATAC